MTSKPVRPGPRRSCASDSSATAASSDGSDASAVEQRRRPRLQLHRRRGDDAERAFAADHQVAQVVAGVVLAQAASGRPRRRRRRSRPRGPGTARARCRSAAPACRRRWWRGCRRSCSCPRRPRLSGNSRPASAAACLDRPAARSRLRRSSSCSPASIAAHPVHARQAQHDLAAAGIGHRAADQAGVAALRDDADAGGAQAAPPPPPRRWCAGRTTAEVAAVVAPARRGRGIVPQGGNTGLVGGGARRQRPAGCCRLARMNRVRAIDAANLHDDGRGRLRAADGAGGGRARPACCSR